MTDPRLRARYGLKYNPFNPDIPMEDIWPAPGFDLFASRVENLTRSGGFGMLTGAVGSGKSKAFQAGPGDRDTALERETEDRKLAYEAGRSPGGRGFVVPDQDACPASAIVRLEIGAEQAVRWPAWSWRRGGRGE